MKNLSLREFKEICDAISPRQYIFSSANQPWDRVEHTAKMELTFRIMLIALNPNVICFKNSFGSLCLNRVKNIKIPDTKSVLGEVFTIICGDSGSNINDVAYTIIAR